MSAEVKTGCELAKPKVMKTSLGSGNQEAQWCLLRHLDKLRDHHNVCEQGFEKAQAEKMQTERQSTFGPESLNRLVSLKRVCV
ncbi:Hypothetical predicted protein [Xyrichtys novacula]|uniref:Uncharacterized protein n=1 Tax=Xyrichtys novacula TaxID=13765 RepID=A0AAV1EXV5_XYRNO|nr:Hypothetical predicted protein [Xyrichtys novacula]